jgi:hypothetical protein
MKGGFLQALSPSLYTDSANAIGAGPYETHVAGTFNQQMTNFDSASMAHTNAMDKINSFTMEAGIKGAAEMQGQSSQNGGSRKRQNQYQNQQQYQNQFQQQYQNQFQQNQNQKQYQNQQQNQRGGVWNQMIGEAVAPLVLLGLQQYYGPRSKSNRSNKGKRTRRFRK